MATHSKDSSDQHSAGNQRVLQSLIHYLRQRNIQRDKIPFNDPVLQSKTVAQINTAFDVIEKETHTQLDDYYLKLMDGHDEYCTTPGVRARNTEWVPISKLRYTPLSCQRLMAGNTMLIFSPIDVFTVMSTRIELERTIRCFYGLQSLLAKEKASYYLAYTANPRARTPSWRLRSLGQHEIAKGLPVVLSATSSFSGKAQTLFRELNPLPALQAIPPNQSSLHDFIVQIITSNTRSTTVNYEGDQFTDVNLTDDAPPLVAHDTRPPGRVGSANDAILERHRQMQNAELPRNNAEEMDRVLRDLARTAT